MNDHPSEAIEGLRRLDMITRNLPNIELEKILSDAGLVVEACRGIWIITKPDPL